MSSAAAVGREQWSPGAAATMLSKGTKAKCCSGELVGTARGTAAAGANSPLPLPRRRSGTAWPQLGSRGPFAFSAPCLSTRHLKMHQSYRCHNGCASAKKKSRGFDVRSGTNFPASKNLGVAALHQKASPRGTQGVRSSLTAALSISQRFPCPAALSASLQSPTNSKDQFISTHGSSAPPR